MRVLSSRLKPALLLSLLLWSCGCAAKKARNLCAQSCANCFGSVRFNDTDPADSAFAQSCRSRLALSSHYLCLDLNCAPDARDVALRTLNTTCQKTLGVSIPSFTIVANFTSDEIDHMRRISRHDSFSAENPLGEVVLPSHKFFKSWFETLDALEYIERHHFLYGLAMTVFWVVVVAIGAVHKLFLALTRFYGSKSAFSSTGIIDMPRAWLKRNVVIPATFGYRCAQNVWWCTIPPRVQTLTILAFLIINVVLSIHGYRITSENMYFPTARAQILRYASDRTGIISFANFPIIWLFGMRNNFAIWLTGWDFGTYNNFHRWAARIATLQAVIHSVGYTVLVLDEGGWDYLANWFTWWFWNAGELATVLMCALFACSFYWIRRRHYETFLVLHIGLSILVLITMLGHVSIFNGQFDGFVWVPVYIWVFDRAWRLFRILAFNLGSWSSHALAIYDPSANIVRLNVPINKIAYKPRPGTYYYLMVLDDSRCWESHPFTVASVSSQSIPDSKALSEDMPLLNSTIDATAMGHDHEMQSESRKDHMTFLIRPYDSFTSRLRNLAEGEGSNHKSLRVLVEGPYGHTQPLGRYDHVVFIVGGTGVVTALSYLPLLSSGTRGPKSIELHWAVREPSFVQDVLSNDIGNAFGTDKISVDIYMSQEVGVAINELPSQVRQHPRRPDVTGVVMSAVERAGKGSLAVVACGPARMADDARLTVVKALEGGRSRIDYFEESFTW